MDMALNFRAGDQSSIPHFFHNLLFYGKVLFQKHSFVLPKAFEIEPLIQSKSINTVESLRECL